MTDNSVVYVKKQTSVMPTTDSKQDNKKITYVNSTLYDYYTDYELNGKERSSYKKNSNGASYRNWYPFRQFDQALSDYYSSKWSSGTVYNGGKIPLYTGHFQPSVEGWDHWYADIARTLNLYGWSDNLRNFMSVNNSTWNNGSSGQDQYAYAAQGLVHDSLNGYSSSSLGSGNLRVKDGTFTLPHFDEDFLSGNNSKNAVLASVYNNVQFPFVKVADSYYEKVDYYTGSG